MVDSKNKIQIPIVAATTGNSEVLEQMKRIAEPTYTINTWKPSWDTDPLSNFRVNTMVDGQQFSIMASTRQEKGLHDALVQHTSGKGARFDHPLVANVISSSFIQHPELLKLYHS